MSFLIASGHVEVEAKTDKAKSQITALIGAMGGLGPVAGAAAASMAAAGAGVAAFGVAAGKQVAEMKKAADAQKKYQDAVIASGKGSAEAAKAQLEYQRMLGAMPKATQEATVAFQSLKDSYSEWSDSLADDTMPVFTKSFAVFQALLPKTTGLVQGTSRELDRLVTVIAGGVASPGFDTFMGKVENLSTSTLHAMTTGLIDLARSLSSFSAGGGFDEFVATAKEAGPLLGETLANLAELALNLTSAGGDLGITMLTVANALAEMANAIPPEVLSTFLQLYAGMRLLKIGIAGVTAVTSSAAVAQLTAFVRAAQFGGVGSAIAGVTQRMTLLQRVGGSLGVLGIAAFAINELAEASRGAPPDLDKLNTSLKTLATTGKFTGELKATFGDMDGFVAKLGKLKTESAALEKAKPFTAFSGLGAFTDTAITKLDDLVRGTKSLGATKDDFKAVDQQLAAMATNGYANQAAEHFRNFKAAALAGGMSLKEFNAAFPEYRAGAAGLKAEAELVAAGMGVFGRQAMDTKAKLDAQKASADGLRASLIALNDTNRSAHDARVQFEAGIDALTASFKEHGATLNEDTAAGQANAMAMSQAAKGHDEMLATSLAAGESLESMTGKSDKLRTTMMRLATEAFGGNKKAAQEYVNTLLGTPESVATAIKLERQEAITGLQAVQAAIQKTPGAKKVTVSTLNAAAIKALEEVGYKTRTLKDGRTEVFTANGKSLGSIEDVSRALDILNGKTANTYTNHYITNYTQQRNRGYDGNSATGARRAGGATGGRYTGAGFRTRYATGGRVQGPGTGTSDDVFAPWLSNGEWVIQAEAVRQYGDRFLSMVNDGTLKLGAGFAKGGKVSKAEKDARKSATPDLTISHFGRVAGYKTTEFAGDLARPDSLADLVGALNGWRNKIKAATHGSSEAKLLKQLDGAGKALLANEKKLAGVNKALDGAKDKLGDLKGKFDQLKSSVSSSLISFGNITKIGKYGTSPDTLIKQLSMDAGRTTEFAKQLEALKAKGLNATAIADIAGAGITGGGMATAQSLLTATPEQIKHINELQKQLETSANKAGTVTADAMYGAGIKAAEGLVKGLTSQQKAIEATMMNIAKSMEKSLKAALGIKSPSKLMEPIGEFSAQGVEVGWTKRLAKGSTLLSGNTAGLRTRPALMAGASAGAATATMAPVVNLTVNVSSHDLLTNAAERKRFAVLLAKDTNDALLTYQKGRRR